MMVPHHHNIHFGNDLAIEASCYWITFQLMGRWKLAVILMDEGFEEYS
jgi:hypothetical protein